MNNCKQCGSKIEIKRPRDKDKQFCDRKCVARFFKKPKFRKCSKCGDEFKIKESSQKYCSNKCRVDSNRKYHFFNCKKCGNKFYINNIAYRKRGGALYCSHSCSSRIYDVDESFFKHMTEKSAYLLGFIFADGHQNGSELSFHLSKKDKSHLYKIKKLLNSDHKIKSYNCQTVLLKIGSKEICSDLLSLGCMQNKTDNLSFPKMENIYKTHFIRGFFDGDGCFYYQKNGKNKRFSIYSHSHSLLNEISLFLKEEGIHHNISFKRNTLSTGRRKSIEKIHKIFYENVNDEIILTRKKIKMDEFIYGNGRVD